MQVFIDYASFVALLMLAAAVISQMFKIKERRSAEDLSLLAISIRFTAMLIILVKMITLRDVYLVSGQSVLLVVYVLYIIQVLHWKLKSHL